MTDVTGPEFAEWMKRERIKVSRVSVDTGLDPNTVYAFRRGESVTDSTRKLLLDFKARWNAEKPVAKAVTG